jgi:hypothetical protein
MTVVPGQALFPLGNGRSTSVTTNQGRPLGHFIRISITTTVASALKTYYAYGRAFYCCAVGLPAGVLNHFWIQMAVSRRTMVSELKRR